MSSSIVLLLALQLFWLQKVYDDGLESIRRESHLLLRNSIRSLQDSIIQRNIITLDSVGDKGGNAGIRFRFRGINDSLSRSLPALDSLRSFAVGRELQRVEIQVRSSETGDSLKQIIASPVRSYMENDPGMRSFLFRTGMDTLRNEEVKKKFAVALAEADLNLSFEIKKTTRGKPYVPEQKYSIVTDPVPANPIEMWVAYFPQPGKKILSDMLPQFLFCFFLSLVTITAFYIMHKSIRSQEKLMQIKNEFISNITHELKTPVATVSVALEALKNFDVLNKPEQTKEYLDIAQSELNRLTLMTDKILKTALFEEKDLSFEKEQLDLAILCKEIIGAMKLVFEKHSAKVLFNKEGDEFSFTGSKLHLSNVIYNLLDNTLKYSNEGVEITINLKAEKDRFVFSVKDTGFGIPQEYEKKIFEKFFRVPTGDIHNIKGYGLGLSYVANVIAGHRGDIQLESRVGKGSCFTIILPRNLQAS